MSRSNEDKYDNNRNSGPNNRRQYRLLSSEEILAGKKSYWSELEITGVVRNLSPELWKLTHLTSLFLNDNSLSRLPADLSKLVNLTVLDVSCNKLRSLPQELGELIYLR
ncbi:hypothetical protein V9T40_003663 [Parthenolecanium corni]|uniref:Uncharacterized protein n=1 Tax=Parthenolecanium corni TaxID=536013 RepID=A0AAN9Y9X6_9HEMI